MSSSDDDFLDIGADLYVDASNVDIAAGEERSVLSPPSSVRSSFVVCGTPDPQLASGDDTVLGSDNESLEVEATEDGSAAAPAAPAGGSPAATPKEKVLRRDVIYPLVSKVALYFFKSGVKVFMRDARRGMRSVLNRLQSEIRINRVHCNAREFLVCTECLSFIYRTVLELGAMNRQGLMVIIEEVVTQMFTDEN